MLIFTTDKINIQLTKSGADIFDLMKRKSDRSMPVDVPSTPEMDELVGYAFEVNRTLKDVQWNPNKKAPIIYNSSDGLPLLRGYAQLTDIIRKDQAIIYRMTLYGETRDMITEFGDKLLVGNDDPADDLSFSEYTHPFTFDTMVRSWDFNVDRYSSGTDASGDGIGYLYPMIDIGANAANIRKFNTLDWRPGLFYREILYKIFEKAGYVWQSDFLDSDLFKRLVLPYSGQALKISSASMLNASAAATRITSALDRSFYNTPSKNSGPDRSTGQVAVMNNETTDPSNQFDPGTGIFTAADDMEIVVSGQLKLNAEYTAAATLQYPHNSSFDHYGDIIFEVIKETGGTNYTPMGSFACRTFFNNLTQVGGVDEAPTGTFTDVITGAGYFQSAPFKLKAGEKVYIKFSHYQDDYFGSSWSKFKVYINTGSFINYLCTSSVVVGQDIDPTIALPFNLKQRDFFSMLVKRFNLYFEPVDENVIRIEPRDDFYTSETMDISQFLDSETELIFQPMGLLNAKEYKFEHDKDDDLINKTYFDKYGYTYGRKRIFTENDFLTEVKTINDMIAPTPSVSQLDRIIPSISYANSSGQLTAKATKPRMLYYGGKKTCLAWTNTEEGVETTYTTYPFSSGVQDDPFDPTILFTFGIPNEIYHKAYPSNPTLKITTNDLYNAYWANTIADIANKDSKVVTGNFWITPKLYFLMTFSKQYFFNNAYHRLLEIPDYFGQDEPSLTTCKFLKLERPELDPASTSDITGGRGGTGLGNGTDPDGIIYDTGVDINKFKGLVAVGGGISTGSGGVIYTDSAYGGLVNAGETILGEKNMNVSVLGGDGVSIYANTENVTLVNSEVAPVKSNVMVLNNMPVYETLKITLTPAELATIHTTPFLLILNTIEDAVIDILDVYGILEYGTAAYPQRDIHLQTGAGNNLYAFGSHYTNQTYTHRHKAERVEYHLYPNESVYLHASGEMSTGDGDMTLIINYRTLQL